MGRQFGHKHAALDRPLFGQFLRQVAGLRSAQIEGALAKQRQSGGRVGAILERQKLVDHDQCVEALRRQARWVAHTVHADITPHGLPYPTFLSLCMPAYNEADNIELTLESACVILGEFVDRFEIVVVDDGSRDATSEKVSQFAERDARVRLIRHEGNRGYGAAVSTAMKAAAGSLVMFTDSDGQFNLLDLPQFLSEIDTHDLVIGYRFDRADSAMRKLNAWAWTKLVGVMFGLQVRDLDCAFKLFRRSVLDQLELSMTGAAINAQIMAECVGQGFRIRELPVMHYPCYAGEQTGARPDVIVRAFRELYKLRRHRIRRRPGRKSAAPTPHPVATTTLTDPLSVAELVPSRVEPVRLK